jgi:hypothetical protein
MLYEKKRLFLLKKNNFNNDQDYMIKIILKKHLVINKQFITIIFVIKSESKKLICTLTSIELLFICVKVNSLFRYYSIINTLKPVLLNY